MTEIFIDDNRTDLAELAKKATKREAIVTHTGVEAWLEIKKREIPVAGETFIVAGADVARCLSALVEYLTNCKAKTVYVDLDRSRLGDYENSHVTLEEKVSHLTSLNGDNLLEHPGVRLLGLLA